MADPSIERGAKALDAAAAVSADAAEKVPMSENDAQRLIKLIATWPRIRYEREREDIAKSLGVRVGQLDKMVSASREPETSGTALPFLEVVPFHKPVDGADLLADLTEIIRSYVVLDSEQTTLCALWIVLSYLANSATVLPILVLTSPERGCGKSTLLDLTGRLVNRPIPASNISSAALFRTVEKWFPTLLIDEADSFLRDNDELRGLLNSGHTRWTAYVIRTVGDDFEPRHFSTWGPKAIALIGPLPDTLEARSIKIAMRRKAKGERTINLRHTDNAQFDELRSRIARFATDIGDAFAAARPRLPESLENRAGDNAEPLVAIADLAGGRWPAEARRAVLRLIGAAAESPSFGEELLSDIRRAAEQAHVDDPTVDRISTAALRGGAGQLSLQQSDAPRASGHRRSHAVRRARHGGVSSLRDAVASSAERV